MNPAERETAAIFRKVTLRLLPFLGLLYFFNDSRSRSQHRSARKLQMVPPLDRRDRRSSARNGAYGLGSGIFYDRLRLHSGGAEQPDAAKVRRAPLDSPHSRELGIDLRRHDVRGRGVELHRPPLSAGLRGGRLLPGHRSVFDLLVSAAASGPGHGALHGRLPPGLDGRRSPHRSAASPHARHRGPRRLAVGVSPRRPADGRSRSDHVRVSDGSSGAGRLADAGRTVAADRATGERVPPRTGHR